MEWKQLIDLAPNLTGHVVLALVSYAFWGKMQEQAKEIAALHQSRVEDLKAMTKPSDSKP